MSTSIPTRTRNISKYAGALLATGILNTGVRSEADAALALLGGYVENRSVPLKTSAIVGLGLAYAGSHREDLLALLLPLVVDDTQNMEIASLAALASGFIGDLQLDTKWTRLMGLGLALLYLGQKAAIDTLKAIPHQISKQDALQAFSTLGVGLLAMGEDTGAEVRLHTLHHLMHYGELVICKMVPLALGLISAPNLALSLSKYNYDQDLAVAFDAIFTMGLTGAGTNNARLAQMLLQLAGYRHKEPDCLSTGAISLNPFFRDYTVTSRTAVAGLLATLTAFTNAKSCVNKYHWLPFFLTPAMYQWPTSSRCFLWLCSLTLPNKRVSLTVASFFLSRISYEEPACASCFPEPLGNQLPRTGSVPLRTSTPCLASCSWPALYSIPPHPLPRPPILNAANVRRISQPRRPYALWQTLRGAGADAPSALFACAGTKGTPPHSKRARLAGKYQAPADSPSHCGPAARGPAYLRTHPPSRQRLRASNLPLSPSLSAARTRAATRTPTCLTPPLPPSLRLARPLCPALPLLLALPLYALRTSHAIPAFLPLHARA
ncbi:hypothetical protein DENSPDRAFT_876606 [Dentipellis sp. KUC8613]|nr:hypothetical protein DENSPDRAFT_876606 [Dentipellis sp. KUC8613]